MNNARLRMFARAAVIAALYTVLTLAIPVASYGQIQVRISEALMILPVFTPAAVPGLFVGCVLANALGALLGLTAAWDILFGSVATLLAACLDTFLFWSIAFAGAAEPWVTWALGDLGVKLVLGVALLLPFRLAIARWWKGPSAIASAK